MDQFEAWTLGLDVVQGVWSNLKSPHAVWTNSWGAHSDETRNARVPDSRQQEAALALSEFFDSQADRVFFSRQLEVLYESRWFHWVTNRTLWQLVQSGILRSESRSLRTGQTLNLMWHRSYRYYRREANKIVALVEEYADPNIGGAIGLHAESLVLEGFASRQFVMRGREVNKYGQRTWRQTAHDLDFIFERDGLAYGVEVKNTLGYMDHDELLLKLAMCHELGITPVFACRMLPKSWIKEIVDAGGFALILKYQLVSAHGRGVRGIRQIP